MKPRRRSLLILRNPFLAQVSCRSDARLKAEAHQNVEGRTPHAKARRLPLICEASYGSEEQQARSLDALLHIAHLKLERLESSLHRLSHAAVERNARLSPALHASNSCEQYTLNRRTSPTQR